MYSELGRGSWSNGFSQLNVVDGSSVQPVRNHADAEIGYEFRSVFTDETTNPPAVQFTPSELREMIEQVKDEVGDPFSEPTFEPLCDWLETNGEDVIAEVGDTTGLRKQFKMKWNEEEGTPYLKVQRRDRDEESGDDHWLISSPTLGPDEFVGIFESVTVL